MGLGCVFGSLSCRVSYLLKEPPKKQILQDKELIFQEQKIDEKQKKTQQLLHMVRTVRNNLFHGGKYHSNDDNRDELLIRHSLEILLVCKELDKKVKEKYDSY